jgi:hypothetical protein
MRKNSAVVPLTASYPAAEPLCQESTAGFSLDTQWKVFHGASYIAITAGKLRCDGRACDLWVARLDHFENNLSCTWSDKAYLSCGSVREINDPVVLERASIVDPDNH